MKLLTQWAVTSSILILIVLAVRYLFRNRLSARLRYALWGIVLLRLLVPLQVELPAAAGDALPVLASSLAQDIPPRLEDTMLYALPTEHRPSDSVQPGEQPEYSRTLHSETNREYYSGGVVYDGNSITRYFFMMPASELLMMIWKTGVGLCLLVILYSNWGFSLRLGRRRRKLEGTDTPIPVYVAEGLPSPCLFGALRPAVYVTPEAAANPDTLRHVLAHELTHCTHFDHIWSLLRVLALALHWYNPLVWLAAGLSKQDGELACDEGAVARLGEEERIPYGRTLVDMVAARPQHPADLLSCSTAMTGGKKSIQQRVAQIVKKPKTVKTALFTVIAVTALAAVFVFAGRGGETPDELSDFLGQVERALEVEYRLSPLSSELLHSSITDDDLLAQAKEILLETTPLDAGEEPDLTHAIASPGISVTGGGPNGQEVLITRQYVLLTQEELTYVARSWEAEGSIHYEAIGKLPRTAPPRLKELARQQHIRAQSHLTFTNDSCNLYRTRLEAAQGIWLNMPMLHDGRVLTDPEGLEQVKELLMLEPLPQDSLLERDENWADIIIDTIAFSLTQPAPDWTGADASNKYFIVYTEGDFYCVCSGWDEEGGYYLGAVSRENWNQAREILESAPSVDSRQQEEPASLYVAPNGKPEQVSPVTGTEKPDTDDGKDEWEKQQAADGKPEQVSPVTGTEKPDTDDGKDEWEKQQAAEYQAAGVTVDGKSYYYQGQLVNIFLDIRANRSFYTLDTNPTGAVNVKIIRDKDDKISSVEYMSDEEAAALLADLRDGAD